MRHYRYQATDDTVEALRLLRGAWVGYRIEREAFVVRLADARVVRIRIEQSPVEPDFEVARIRADVVDGDLEGVGDVRDPGDFAATTRHDVVLLSGATWIEGEARAVRGDDADAAGDGAGAVQFSGNPMQIADAARAACVTTDAVVVATSAGSGVLVRTGVRPRTIEVVTDREEIAQFLQGRGYTNG